MIRVYAKFGQQVVIERGNLGKVVLELSEAKQVIATLPQAVADAQKGITEDERQRQIKEHEADIAKLRDVSPPPPPEPAVRSIGRPIKKSS